MGYREPIRSKSDTPQFDGLGTSPYREPVLRHVLKARLLHLALVLCAIHAAAPRKGQGLVEHIVPALQGRAIEGVVNGLQLDVVVLELDPAARVEVLVDHAEEGREVLDGPDHVPCVHVVELVRVDPLVFHVVDLEAAIGRYAGRC